MGAGEQPTQTQGAAVRPIVAGDAPGLAALIERCYGDGYPKQVMYRPDELAALIEAGDFSGVVAEADGSIVGHIGYSWPSSEATVVEAGTTVVDPQWRGQGLMMDLAVALAGLIASDGASGFIHFPTTAHEVMQRASLGSGGRETGIMLAYLPPDTRGRSEPAGDGGRLAVTVVYQPVAPAAAQEIFIPARYEELILGLATSLGLERSVAGPYVEPAGGSELTRAFEESRGLERVSVERIGSDTGARVEEIAGQSPATLIHVDLPMDDPGIDHATGQLLELGFAFAAWLPGWDGRDVLRLQRIADPTPDELAPDLFSPEARGLTEMIGAELSGRA